MTILGAREARPLRVLYFAGTHGDWGGAGRVMFTTLSLLDRSRIEPIVALPMEGPAQALLDDLGIEYVLWGGMGEYRSAVQYTSAIVRTLLWLRRRGIDVVHVNKANDWRPAEHLAARVARVPIVTHFHTVNHDRAPATRMSSAIAAVSKFVAEHSDTQDVPVRVIYNSVNVARFGHGRSIRGELGIAEDALVVTFAGQMRRIKGLDLFVNAARKVSIPKVRFLVAGAFPQGRGIDDAYTESTFRELCAGDDRIIYAGYREDMPNVYHSSDIVVVPSRWEEPFGLILIEAGIGAKPVIATCVGGIPEVVRDGETGVLVKPDDEQALVSAIQQLASDAALRMKMGMAARTHVIERFVEQPVRELEDLYVSLCACRSDEVRSTERRRHA